MKLNFLIIAAIVLGALAVAAGAQTTAPPTAAPQAVAVKIAVIDTDAFADSKVGVKKLLATISKIDGLLKPIKDDIVAKQARYNTLVTEIQNAQKTGANVDQAKIDEGTQLESDIKRRQEDGQKAYERYNKQYAEPVNLEIGKAVEAYAKAKGYDIVLDAAKFAGTMIVINQGIDITSAFIADFNAKNPAAAATATTATPKP